MSEIFSSKKRTELRSEYCIANGYSHFNDTVLNDYTDYLELRLMEALNKANDGSTNNSGLDLHHVRLALIAYEEAKHSFLPPNYRKETATNIVNHVLGNL